MKTGKMSKSQLKKWDGRDCPVCGTGLIRTDQIEWEGSRQVWDCDCDSCQARWIETYRLVEVEILEIGKENA